MVSIVCLDFACVCTVVGALRRRQLCSTLAVFTRQAARALALGLISKSLQPSNERGPNLADHVLLRSLHKHCTEVRIAWLISGLVVVGGRWVVGGSAVGQCAGGVEAPQEVPNVGWKW